MEIDYFRTAGGNSGRAFDRMVIGRCGKGNFDA